MSSTLIYWWDKWGQIKRWCSFTECHRGHYLLAFPSGEILRQTWVVSCISSTNQTRSKLPGWKMGHQPSPCVCCGTDATNKTSMWPLHDKENSQKHKNTIPLSTVVVPSSWSFSATWHPDIVLEIIDTPSINTLTIKKIRKKLKGCLGLNKRLNQTSVMNSAPALKLNPPGRIWSLLSLAS